MATQVFSRFSKVERKKTRLFVWILGMLCVVALIALLTQMVWQFVTPAPPPSLSLVQDIPLPGALPDSYRTAQNPLAPGIASLFDHFDFQSLDASRHLLFIAHTGPSPDRMHQLNPSFDPVKDAKTDGNVLVFDTLSQKVVVVLPIPQVAGIVVAPDIQKVYAADANDAIIYAIDEQTWKTTAIQLEQNDGPDSLEYDQDDHLVFVSNPGVPSNPDQSQAVDRKNQNVIAIPAKIKWRGGRGNKAHKSCLQEVLASKQSSVFTGAKHSPPSFPGA